MKLVVDTNILLVSISPRSSSNWLWQAILSGTYELYVTTDILLEYMEIITQKMGKEAAEITIDLLSELPNVHFIQKYYFWQLIEADPDDNKFLDCAIAAGANYLVSNDKHFNVIKDYPYFKVKLVKLSEFQSLFKK